MLCERPILHVIGRDVMITINLSQRKGILLPDFLFLILCSCIYVSSQRLRTKFASSNRG
jgi:hypothetical protein